MYSVLFRLYLVWDIIYSELNMKWPIPWPLTGATVTRALECFWSLLRVQLLLQLEKQTDKSCLLRKMRGISRASAMWVLWSSPWCWNEAISLKDPHLSTPCREQKLRALLYTFPMALSVISNRTLTWFIPWTFVTMSFLFCLFVKGF